MMISHLAALSLESSKISQAGLKFMAKSKEEGAKRRESGRC